ncbi:MAG: hypothetical protein LBQ90_07300 [Synergistaceae bacterium]|nr:hypothetical protein [Synergistaceae bacterium]
MFRSIIFSIEVLKGIEVLKDIEILKTRSLKTGFLQRSRRRGISIVECLILMVVVAIAIGAIMQTVAWSMNLQVTSRENMGAYLFVNNWFETLESLEPSSIDAGNFSSAGDIRAAVQARMGKKPPYRYEVTRGPTNLSGGVYTVRLEVWPSSTKARSLVVSRDVNRFSTKTAPDNAQRD